MTMDNIVDLKERFRRKKGGSDGSESDSDKYEFVEIAEFVRMAASDIVWLAALATGEPYITGDDFRHNLSKREIVEDISTRLKHLQSEFEALQQSAEQEEPGAAS
jgi:hypothetical protein